MLARMWRKRNTPPLLVGLQACTTTLEISLAVPQKIGHRVQFQTLILGMLQHLGVNLSLGVVGLGVESAPKVCSGHRLKLEGTLDPGDPSYSWCWDRCGYLTCDCGYVKPALSLTLISYNTRQNSLNCYR